MSDLTAARAKLSEMHQKGDGSIKLTEGEMKALRAWILPDIRRYGHESFTCDNCEGRESCPYIFDPYSTGGDCLASK